MPEYRRFISYFYEYIDGKRQRNAGFAKVELRDAMWRILLKITVEAVPESLVWVYGFVREPDRLQGILLGEIRPVQQIAEEWAFRADAPIGSGSYGLGDLAGIWVESSDGRRFVTVWDEGEIDPERFMTEGRQENPNPGDAGGSEEEERISEEKGSGEAGETANVTMSEVPDAVQSESDGERQAVPEDSERECGGQAVQENIEAEDNGQAVPENGETECTGQVGSEDSKPESSGVAVPERARAVVEELFRKRAAFQPFDDAGIRDCVMILPCDIARLQQENWKVGRSSFLQHGFYQYRHLLLGAAADGTYILGVPGIRNPQESYMAQMFGYECFREAARRDGGQNFGYWCRELKHGL